MVKQRTTEQQRSKYLPRFHFSCGTYANDAVLLDCKERDQDRLVKIVPLNLANSGHLSQHTEFPVRPKKFKVHVEYTVLHKSPYARSLQC